MFSCDRLSILEISLFVLMLQSCSCAIFMDDGLYSVDDSSILSESRNLTVHHNETVQLPCLVKKSPNTVVSH